MRLEARQKSFFATTEMTFKTSKNDFEESEGPKSEIDRNAEICLTTLHSRQAPVQLGPRATSLPSTRQHLTSKHPTPESRQNQDHYDHSTNLLHKRNIHKLKTLQFLKKKQFSIKIY